MADDPKAETYTEAETAKRAAATLKVMLATPHKPHKVKNEGRQMSERGDGIDWTDTSEEMVRDILAQGETFLQAQFQSALASDQRATTLASILVTVSVAVFAGALAIWDEVPDDALYSMSAMAALLLAAAACAAWAARPIDFWFPGSRPEQWYDGREKKRVDMLGGAAENIQYQIDENEAFMSNNQLAVRFSFVLALISPLAALAVWRFVP